jgi:DNA-directed RNA polymerase subunit RPC12/RpoP
MSDDDEGAELCTVCRKREPVAGRVCNPCRLGIAVHLGKLLKRLAELPLHLAPSSAPPGERVSTSRTGSPAPARLDVLNLLGHGALVSLDLAAQRPLVQRWCTTREVDVTRRGVPTCTVKITEWHQELVRDPTTGDPILVTDDDQVGLIPPREWLGQQVDAWRAAFGHARRRPPARVPDAEDPGEPLSDDALNWLARSAPAAVVARAWMSRHLLDAYRHGRAQLITGMSPGFNGDRPTEVREDDPLADEWGIRFGEPADAQAPADNVAYLNTWLDRACDHDGIDLHRFTAELRALNAELGRALGEKVDQEYLGRCPSTVTDRDSGDSSTCGAALWQDPFTSVVTCPRCRSTHGPRVIDLMRLAQEIRRVWPLDRRRRYSWDDREALPDVSCPKCGQHVIVFWRDVTGTDDGWFTWFVPAGVMCPGGCAEAPGVLR